jgi:hypothetical protein
VKVPKLACGRRIPTCQLGGQGELLVYIIHPKMGRVIFFRKFRVFHRLVHGKVYNS